MAHRNVLKTPPDISPTNHSHSHRSSSSSNSNNNALQQCLQTASTQLDRLDRSSQLAVLSLGVFLFFGCHNFLQEYLIQMDAMKGKGVLLGWAEVLGVTVGSYVERTWVRRERGRAAPLAAYPALTACLFASSTLSNWSLNFINFPTKVVFRSCKLLPTMLLATLWHGQVHSPRQYACAAAVCIGLVVFAAADWQTQGPVFHPFGIVLVLLSVVADAILPNAQERLLKGGSSRLEVTLYTNVLTLGAMTVTMSGDLISLLRLLLFVPTTATASSSSSDTAHHHLALFLLAYTVVAYVAISVHMNVVQRFGGVTAVLVATGRKGMTLVLSFVCFPKAFSWWYVGGAVLVLGGLVCYAIVKQQEKKQLPLQPPEEPLQLHPKQQQPQPPSDV